MNVTEVESALAGLSTAHPTICELITLPNVSVEGRISHAVRIGKAPANAVDAYYLTGGVHAREWGSCEILINLATDLCDAYASATGLAYEGKYFSAAEVKAVMERINIIIFPCVNPDGRNYAQGGAGLWRKNRNPANSGGDQLKIGIDINRNQDFLWDFNTAFAPGAVNDFVASTDPRVDTYHGSAPHSESETKNINYIHDTYTRICWYVDVHSYSEDILYVWGDDEAQVTDSTKTFQNSAYNHQRGLIGGDYGEYIADNDLSKLISLSEAFTRTLSEVRGKYYVAKPSFSLYPTSGTNQDYAYSRHLDNPGLSNALSFTVEWGTEFQPPWTEMEEIIKDVSAGLLGLGLEAIGIDSVIVTNRDTFSKDGVDSSKDYDDAFYVIYDGFSPNDLGLPASEPTIRFVTSIGGSQINSIKSFKTGVIMENAAAPASPQRIMFIYRIHFNNTSAFTAEKRDIYVEATLAGIRDVAQIHLLVQPSPYMLDGPVSWLSTDVRVFQLRPGQKVHSSSLVTLQDPDSVADAPFNYIQALLAEMRGYGNSDAPSFESLSSNELELARTVSGTRVLNFAVAKVRYRSNTQDAVDVRAFFRTFNTMVSDLSYTSNTGAQLQNYRRTGDGRIPLLGINRFFSGGGNQIVSIPYFAERRVDSGSQSMTAQHDDTNKRTLAAAAAEGHTYFGCWLDFNQTEPQFPVSVPTGTDGPFAGRLPIVQLVRGIHQCLVAEIRFQPGMMDPISNGSKPASSDRLAQRNLAIVESDNPGVESTHQVQHTFLLKPSLSVRGTGFSTPTSNTPRQVRYDELVFLWNDLPRETIANLYLPEWQADNVIALAGSLRPGPKIITKVDAHTISFTVGDVAYIPIPGEIRNVTPGLLTLQLPMTINDGQIFSVDIQHHAGLTTWVDTRQEKKVNRVNFSRRHVLGAFQVKIKVGSGELLIRKLVRKLAVLRYILPAIPLSDAWHPVFVRYISQLGDQVAGLGIDPSLVPASADDPGLPADGPFEKPNEVTGKVHEIIFDCFGNFTGFMLDSCSELHHIKSQEKGIAEVVLRACREGCMVTVCLVENRISKIIIRC